MDVPTLIRNVQRRFGDSSYIFITEVDIIDWINEGQLRIARETKCLTTSVTANASTYPANRPVDCLKIERISYGTFPLEYVALEDLDSRTLNLSIQDSPILWYIIGEQINLYPDPINTDTTQIKVQYSRIPTTITVVGNPLTLPEAFHQDLVTSVLMRAHERNENWKAVEVLGIEFEKGMSNRVEDTNAPDDTYSIVRSDDASYGDW